MKRNQTHLLPLITLVALGVLGCRANGQDAGAPTTAQNERGPRAQTALSGSTRRGKERPALGAQLDRAGRAAISTATISTFDPDEAARPRAMDEYNRTGPARWATYKDTIAKSLAVLDALDTKCGNQLLADKGDRRYGFLAGVLADDRLWVNSTRGTCGVYLGVEAEAVGAVPSGAGGCGGRSPGDDVIERSYSVLAAGILSGVDDGVRNDDGMSTDSFPYLGAPTTK